MMKRFTLLFAAIALAACNGTAVPERPVEICIDASVGSLTRVSYSGDATGFDAGDRIAVYAWTGSASEVPAERVVDGIANTLDSQGKWDPEAQMLWKTVADPHYFLGIYPAPATRIADFSAVAYTLDPSDYTASDLLLAANLDGLKATDGPVPLMFSHAMAKLNVNLTFRDGWDTTPAVSSVTTKAKGSAIVNYLTGEISAIGDASAVDIPASPLAASGYALSFSGLQVPQAGVKTITVRIGGQNYLYESATDIPLRSGRLTTLSLIIGKDKIEVGQVAVSEWDDGSGLTGGDVNPDIIPRISHLCSSTVQIKPGEDFTVLLWSNCPVTKNNLTLSVYSGDSDLFAIKSVEAHSTWDNVYNVTISFGTPPSSSYEATLGFIANIDGYDAYSYRFDVASSPNP